MVSRLVRLLLRLRSRFVAAVATVARFLVSLRTRFVAAVTTAFGVLLLGIGLVQYTIPVSAIAGASVAPSLIEVSLPPASTSTLAIPGQPTPTIAPRDRIITRVVVAALRIDLPVVVQPNMDTDFPWCNVGLDDPRLSQPGQGRATYIYAHARKGMFLPLLLAAGVNDGAAMLGMIVQAYTNDDQLWLYEVIEVRRHQYYIDAALAVTSDQLWLQTSEGPFAAGVVGPKVQVIGRLISTSPVADPAAAHPVPHPIKCGA